MNADDICCTLDPDNHDGPCVWFCSNCGGTGDCPDCDGTGGPDDVVHCETCDGTGACPMGCVDGHFIDETATRPVITIDTRGLL